MTRPTVDAGLFDIMYSCRAMRRLKPDPVPEATLLQLVDAAIQAPSSSNAQPWRFVIVRDRAQKERLRTIWTSTWGFYLATLGALPARPGEDLALRQRTLAAATWQLDHFADIPAIVCVCIEQDAEQARVLRSPATLAKAVSHFGLGGAMRLVRGAARTSGMVDGSSAYPAVQNLLLSARALGLGAVLTTQHFFVPGAFEAVLDIPPRFTLAAIVPVGWPTGRFGPVRRPEPASVVRWDRWRD